MNGLQTLPDTNFESFFIEASDIISKVPLQEVRYLILQHLDALCFNHFNDHPEKKVKQRAK